MYDETSGREDLDSLEELLSGSEEASPEDAEDVEEPPASSVTWRESAGRSDGPDGYRFGDVTRTTGAKLGNWANKPKEQEGYEFGDLFLKRMVKGLFGS